MARALVIGSGMAGMGAALLLRRFGHDVTVFEALPHAGPLVRGFSRHGLHFETGFHYAGGIPSGSLGRYLDALDISPLLQFIPLDPVGGEVLRFRRYNLEFAVPRDRDALVNSLDSLFPRHKKHTAAFLENIAKQAAYSPYLHAGQRDFDPYALFNDTSLLSKHLDATGLPVLGRSILSFRCALYGVHPDQARFNDFSLLNEAYMQSASTIAGGGAALVAAFERRLEQENIELITSAKVTAIELDKMKIRGVHIDNGNQATFVTGDICVYSGSPAALPSLLPKGALRPIAVKKFLNLKETAIPFILFCSSGSDYFKHKQVFSCPAESLDGFFAGAGDPVHSKNHAFYLSGGEGRDGVYPINVITPLPSTYAEPLLGSEKSMDVAAYRQFKHSVAEVFRNELVAAHPELGGDLTVLDSATGRTMQHWSYNSAGSVYGRLHDKDAPPILPSTRLGGLVLAGQNIVMPGLLGSLVSAAVAVGALVGHDKVLKAL